MSAANRGSKRQPNDLYETPEWLTEALIPELAERFDDRFTRPEGHLITTLEPAAGNGAIVRVLERSGLIGTVDAYDLVAAPNIGQWDFLTAAPEPVYDLIITNPPFSLAQQFIERSMLWRKNEKSVVAMLLRVNFLGSRKRAKWLRAMPPGVFVTPKRPQFSKNKHGKLGSDATEYAWFVWQEPFAYTSVVRFLNTEDVK